MSDVMSQNEIDALLSAVSSGNLDMEKIQKEDEDSNKKVRNYDFRNPQKISKDQLRTLEIMHENFTRHLQTFLTGYLRTGIAAEILTVDQFAYSEFSNAIPNPAFLAIINFRPLNGQILMEISNNLIFTIIDKLTGGDGYIEGEFKSYTEIETELLSSMIMQIMGEYARVWDNVLELNPFLEKIEVNPQFAQIVPPNETIALVTMELKLGKIEGMVNICLPYLLLEPIIDKLNTKFWFATSEDESHYENKELMEIKMKNTVVPLVANLGSVKVTVDEILNLSIGDVLKLNTGLGSPIDIKVGNNTKFKGEIGTINGSDLERHRMAIKILEILKEGDTQNE